MKKKCPRCGKKAVKLYINKTIEGRRKWVPIAWYCTSCHYLYQVASDTLIYKTGDSLQKDLPKNNCPKCGLKLVRSYRHKNPKHGKQQWLTIGWYCKRCKYVWMTSLD